MKNSIFTVVRLNNRPVILPVSTAALAVDWAILLNVALQIADEETGLRSRQPKPPQTLHQLAYWLARFGAFAVRCERDVSSLQEQDFHRFRAEVDADFVANLGKTRQQKTRTAEYRALWKAFERLRKHDVIDKNPIPPGEPKRKNGQVYRSYSDGNDIKSEAIIIPPADNLAAVREKLPTPYQHLFDLSIATAGRWAEVEATVLEWQKAVPVEGGREIKVFNKGKLNTLLIPTDVVPAVEALRRCGMRDHKGHVMTVNAFRYRLRIASEAACLENHLYPHFLRHIAASYHAAILHAEGNGQGPDPKLAVQELLNHRDDYTQKVYVHPIALSKERRQISRASRIVNRLQKPDDEQKSGDDA